MDGDLAELERAWKEPEEIAAISDRPRSSPDPQRDDCAPATLGALCLPLDQEAIEVLIAPRNSRARPPRVPRRARAPCSR